MRFVWKYEKVGRILTWGVVLALLLALTPVLPANVAEGAGLLTLTPDEGGVGSQVKVDGLGFDSEQIVQLYFSSDRAGVGDEIDAKVTAYKNVGVTWTDAGGSFSVQFSVPGGMTDGRVQKGVDNGSHYIYAAYVDSKRIVAAAQFFILGPLLVSPDQGRISDWISISGSGLKPSDTINIYFSSQKASIGQSIGQQVTIYQFAWAASVAADGTLGGRGFQIPARLASGKSAQDVHGGEYYFYATYSSSKTLIATLSRFIVLDGEIRLEPAEGTVGTEVKIHGQGLRSNQKITVRYDGDNVLIASGDTATDSTGQFNCAIIVPDSTSGYHFITISDVTGNKPEAHFLIRPKITLSPASAIVNQPVEVSGTGFGEVQAVTVMVNGERLVPSPASVTTNRLGSFTFSFAAPPSAANTTAKVEVSDKAANKAEAQLTVIPLTPTSATITLTPATSLASPGYVGMKVTIDGTKFKPKTAVDVTYGKEKTMAAAKVDTDSRGSFSTPFTIPPGLAGIYTVTATDGTNTVMTTFVMESSAPIPPTPLLPKVASAAKDVTYFDWEDVTDPSGVTYTLQIATDAEFTDVVLEKTGLTTSEYTLTKAEQLKPLGQETAYYCRVRAIDGAGNQGVWTPPVPFYVGLAGAPMASWLKFTLIGLGVVLVGVGAFWVRRIVVSRR